MRIRGHSIAVPSKVRVGFIVPTMNRVFEINRLLQSIYAQDVLPLCVIVVDGSDEPIESQLLKRDGVELIYQREFPPSLTRQRNRGIAVIPEGLTHVGFLDDDLVLLDGAMSSMIRFLEAQPEDLGGASFNIQDVSSGKLRIFAQLFFHSAWRHHGSVLRSGYADNNLSVKQDRFTQWLCGGATVWRTSVLKGYKFDEWYNGYALWEDVDFSFRVSKKWRLAVVAEAKVLHLHKGHMTVLKSKRLGELEVVDRFYFVKKHSDEMSYALAIWATVGTILRNVVYSIQKREIFYLHRAWANARAFARCLGGNISRSFDFVQ